MIRTIKDAHELADNFCQTYELPKVYLHKSYGKTGRCKKFGSVRVDQMRMALAYYIRHNSTLTTEQIARAVGYICHTTVCQNENRVKTYIENKDSVFFPYWQTLLKIV